MKRTHRYNNYGGLTSTTEIYGNFLGIKHKRKTKSANPKISIENRINTLEKNHKIQLKNIEKLYESRLVQQKNSYSMQYNKMTECLEARIDELHIIYNNTIEIIKKELDSSRIKSICTSCNIRPI